MVKIERWPHLSNLSNLSNREMVTTPGSKQRRHDTVNRLSSTKSLLLLSLSAFSQLEEEDRRGELNRKEDAALCLRGADCTDMPLSPPSLPKMSKSSTDMPAALLPLGAAASTFRLRCRLMARWHSLSLSLSTRAASFLSSMTDDSQRIKVNKPMDTAFRLGLATHGSPGVSTVTTSVRPLRPSRGEIC